MPTWRSPWVFRSPRFDRNHEYRGRSEDPDISTLECFEPMPGNNINSTSPRPAVSILLVFFQDDRQTTSILSLISRSAHRIIHNGFHRYRDPWHLSGSLAFVLETTETVDVVALGPCVMADIAIRCIRRDIYDWAEIYVPRTDTDLYSRRVQTSIPSLVGCNISPKFPGKGLSLLLFLQLHAAAR